VAGLIGNTDVSGQVGGKVAALLAARGHQVSRGELDIVSDTVHTLAGWPAVSLGGSSASTANRTPLSEWPLN
jgi:hypothetical protein